MEHAEFAVTIEKWRQRGAWHTLHGHRIFVIDEGPAAAEAETILLIHGFPTASWDWWKIWPALAAHYRLVALDLLGFGFSAKPVGHDYRILEQADLCEALVRELGLSKFHVLAHDYGDTVAQELLTRQNAGTGAGQWLSCLFLNGGLFAETHRALPAQRLLQSPLGRLLQYGMSKKSLRRSFDHIFGPHTRVSDEELDAFYTLFERDGGRRNLHRLMQYMADRRRYRERWLKALEEACCPIGLINGSVDPVSGDHMVQRFLELLGDSYFIERLPEIGHYPHYEAPQAVVDAYRRFLHVVAGG